MEKEAKRKIRELREQKGVTQSSVSESLGISLFAYTKIEKGGTKLTINHIERIAEALGVSPYEILGVTGNSDSLEVETLRKENEALKKDIERYKGIVDTYQDKIQVADSLVELIKHFQEQLGNRKKLTKEEKEKAIKEAGDMFKDFTLE